MDGREVDLLEILRVGKSKKRLQKMFTNLGGGRTDKEAVELAIGRDPEWQMALLRVIQQIELVITSKTVAEVLGLDYADCVKFLLQGGLVPWMTRILGMALPMRNDAAGSNVAARWRQSFVHLVKTVYHLVKDPCNEYNLQPYTLATGMVTPLMKFLDGTQQPLATVWAISALSQLCGMYQDACDKIVSSGCLSQLGRIIYRDSAQKVIVELYKEGYKQDQLDFFNVWLTYKHHLDPASATKMSQQNFTSSLEKHHYYALHLARTTQSHATIILTEVSRNRIYRNAVAKEPTVFKSVLKWLQTPIITHHDVVMVSKVLGLLSRLCILEETAWKFIDTYELPLLLEPLITIPEVDVITSCLELMLVIAGHVGRCRDKLAESDDLMVALNAYMMSDTDEIYKLSLQTILQVADSPQSCVRMVDSGISVGQLAVLRSRSDATSDAYDRLRSLFRKNSWTTWRKREDEYSDFQFSPSIVESEKYKKLGNELFKQEKYFDAIARYTLALDMLPFDECIDHRNLWWPLPAVLYSNRAQCYLKIEDWAAAAKDCTFAVSRTLIDKCSSVMTLRLL
ncbi:uncharacterized protein LOC134182172 isoform X2 [Corticium candelabrum]|uniref:uncharacterized protein LOC134182172 isoform X2 n=1 Tax=Corticium candelabrum TaxID=121492 RepID=UPI002E261A04|nr:uncharacterized protein LOC134182172 isoform X2 [Corticium candelabrum]